MEPCAHAPVMAGTFSTIREFRARDKAFSLMWETPQLQARRRSMFGAKCERHAPLPTGEQAEGTQSSIVKVLLVAAQLTIAQIGIAVAWGPEGHVVIAMIAEPLPPPFYRFQSQAL